MNKALLIIILIIVVVLGVFMWQRSDDTDEVVGTPQGGEYVAPSTIALTHQYTNGTHTYAGKLTVPTPCYDITADASVAESFPEQVSVSISVTGASAGETCAQVVTEKDFTVSFSASQSASPSFRINGATVEAQVTEGSTG
ncbi:MAG: hypothetical protein AAB460_03475 [Patescibacteria group bacterium]